MSPLSNISNDNSGDGQVLASRASGGYIPLKTNKALLSSNIIWLNLPGKRSIQNLKDLNLFWGVGEGEIVRGFDSMCPCLQMPVKYSDFSNYPLPEPGNVASHSLTVKLVAAAKSIWLLLVKCAWHFRLGGCVPGHMCLCARGM